MRANILSSLPDERVKLSLNKLNSILNGRVVEEFFTQLDNICGSGGILEMRLKKPDKKKERQLIFNHRQSLVEQLRIETDPAMSLHLAVVLLVQAVSQRMVHAPGRCVPHIITYLRDKLPSEQHQLLVKLQDCVVLQLKSANGQQLKSANECETPTVSAASTVESETKNVLSVSEGSEFEAILTELLPKVKEIALAIKKVSVNTTDDA